MEWGTPTYPRRLIEVDLPIGAISDAARQGRSVHRGHITAIHIWWARKPLPSCRAVALASTLIDPVDDLCPQAFRQRAAEVLRGVYGLEGTEYLPDHPLELRRGLLRLVTDLSSWRMAQDPGLLSAASELVRVAHEALEGIQGARPFLADPFSGGGSIPLEGLRLGCSVYASDLNPVAALISKVTLEYVQRLGEPLLEEVASWGKKIEEQASLELARFYPDGDQTTPLAYLWFRTMECEAPGCGATVPLTSSFHLWRNGARSVGLRLAGWEDDTPKFDIEKGPLSSFPHQTVRRGAATCLRCGYTMPVERVRAQLTEQQGGASTAQLVAVALPSTGKGKAFRAPTAVDLAAARAAELELDRRSGDMGKLMPLVPEEPLPPPRTLGFRVQRYGMLRWRDLYTPRQLLTISTLARFVREAVPDDRTPGGLGTAVRACLALAVDRVCDYQNTGCSWNPSSASLPHLFTRQALPIIWDFGEANPFGGSSGDWSSAVAHVLRGLRNALVSSDVADVGCVSAHSHPLPTDCANVVITDPPYYDAIPYADLSDFFYVWLRRMLRDDHPDLFATPLVPKEHECVVNKVAGKGPQQYRELMTEALSEARRIVRPDGIGVVIFAHRSTAGWEDLLAAMLEAGWIITASWPIDTENNQRLRARNSAVLASSVHLVCRPREHPDGSLITDTVGNWRDVVDELPRRIRQWLPRLEREGVHGADAIFACLGPALEVYSRHARVEKASGEPVGLKEYLEQVWAVVAREALGMIFEGADATGFEPDARLTAMWLWTLARGQPSDSGTTGKKVADGDGGQGGKIVPGYSLEYDAARKIAQGLGAALDQMGDLVEVKAGNARLLSVAERAKTLFGKADKLVTPRKGRKRAKAQLSLDFMAELDTAEQEGDWSGQGLPTPGATALDRLQQAILLFASGRGNTLTRFLDEEGVGRDLRMWRLALSLSALYPGSSDEKRWLDGLLAQRKGLGV